MTALTITPGDRVHMALRKALTETGKCSRELLPTEAHAGTSEALADAVARVILLAYEAAHDAGCRADTPDRVPIPPGLDAALERLYKNCSVQQRVRLTRLWARAGSAMLHKRKSDLRELAEERQRLDALMQPNLFQASGGNA